VEFLGSGWTGEQSFDRDPPLYMQVSRDGLPAPPRARPRRFACTGSTAVVQTTGLGGYHREIREGLTDFMRQGIGKSRAVWGNAPG